MLLGIVFVHVVKWVHMSGFSMSTAAVHPNEEAPNRPRWDMGPLSNVTHGITTLNTIKVPLTWKSKTSISNYQIFVFFGNYFCWGVLLKIPQQKIDCIHFFQAPLLSPSDAPSLVSLLAAGLSAVWHQPRRGARDSDGKRLSAGAEGTGDGAFLLWVVVY